MVPALPDLYESWGPLHNFFCRSMKLVEKQRVGSRWQKRCDDPQAPYQRLLRSPLVSGAQKGKLRAEYGQLNPFTLKKQIEQKLRIILATR